MTKPRVAILKAEGTNFDEETKWAFDLAGGRADIILMSEVLQKPQILFKYQLLDLPGGFSYGDDLYSGKIWANEILSYLSDVIQKFISKNGIIIGVCNGFQVLVRAGLLPGFGKPNENIGLIFNQRQKFECRWIKIKFQKSNCIFLKKDLIGFLPVEHGEGRFIVKNKTILERLKKNGQIVVEYVDSRNLPSKSYPDNPNGSTLAIAGISDTTGQIFGMMPHPEHHMVYYQYPNWRTEKVDPIGFQIYKTAIDYLRKN